MRSAACKLNLPDVKYLLTKVSGNADEKFTNTNEDATEVESTRLLGSSRHILLTTFEHRSLGILPAKWLSATSPFVQMRTLFAHNRHTDDARVNLSKVPKQTHPQKGRYTAKLYELVNGEPQMRCRHVHYLMLHSEKWNRCRPMWIVDKNYGKSNFCNLWIDFDSKCSTQ